MRMGNENTNKYYVTPGREKGGVSNTMNNCIAKKILGTTLNACRREIKLKYRLLARKYHPDKWVEECAFSKKEAECYFKDISNAYQHLLKSARD